VVLAVSALGLEKVPAIPAGRRAEYFFFYFYGAYRFGYDHGGGQSAAVRAHQNNQVQGHYSYVDSAGKRVRVAYTAGDSGFVPRLEEGETGPKPVGGSGK
jgi:hypothetical protein